MKPQITESIGSIVYTWVDIGLKVIAERFTDQGYAELSFYSVSKEGDSLLHTTKVNLLSTTTMSSLSKRLEKHSTKAPWTDILTYITGKTMEIARRGEPAQEVWPSEEDTLEVKYLLAPLLYLNHPAVIFGDYGSLKSLFALATAYIVQLPYTDNHLGLITKDESIKCLCLDYEDDLSSFRRRLSALQRGFGQAAMPILYRRMTAPLYDAVDQVRRLISDNNIGLLIIDSLGPAARGNLNDAEPAIKYHAALRQLNITSLTLAHTSKDQLTKKRTIFGSVFFTNLARSVWECKSEQETGEDEAIISLKQTKANLSRLHPPLGFRFNFTNNSISITKTDLGTTSLSATLPLSWQIKNFLKRGSFTIDTLAEELNSTTDTIGRTLRRMKTKNQVLRLQDDTWGLSLL